MNRSEIKGSIRSLNLQALRAQNAMREGIEDEEVMLTPSDVTEMRVSLRNTLNSLREVMKEIEMFGAVTKVRSEMTS